MSQDVPESFSLKRWSQRKHAAAASARAVPAVAPTTTAPSVPVPDAGSHIVAPAVPPAGLGDVSATRRDVSGPALPAVESLTFESDFTAFMRPDVAAGTKSAALRKLFSDPRFNVMDGLDVYIGDYSQPDPMPAGMLEKLANVYEAIVDIPAVADAPPATVVVSPVVEPAATPTAGAAPVAGENGDVPPLAALRGEPAIEGEPSPVAPTPIVQGKAP
jgi:hypothetical protein